MSYPGAHVILITFAIDNPDSLENVKVKWIHEIRNFGGLTTPVILVGCKADLRPLPDSPNFVSRNQGEQTASTIGAYAYRECSALTHEGVEDVFETAARASLLKLEGIWANRVSVKNLQWEIGRCTIC